MARPGGLIGLALQHNSVHRLLHIEIAHDDALVVAQIQPVCGDGRQPCHRAQEATSTRIPAFDDDRAFVGTVQQHGGSRTVDESQIALHVGHDDRVVFGEPAEMEALDVGPLLVHPVSEDAVIGHSAGPVASGLENVNGVVHLTRIVVSDRNMFERHALRIADVDHRSAFGSSPDQRRAETGSAHVEIAARDLERFVDVVAPGRQVGDGASTMLPCGVDRSLDRSGVVRAAVALGTKVGLRVENASGDFCRRTAENAAKPTSPSHAACPRAPT